MNAKERAELEETAIQINAMIEGRIGSEAAAEALDELVHDAVTGLASKINNSGTYAQCLFLLEQGYNGAYIFEAATPTE